jgi:hypothetical protein
MTEADTKPRPSLRFTKDFSFFDQRSNAHQWREWKAGDVPDANDVEWLIKLDAPIAPETNEDLHHG